MGKFNPGRGEVEFAAAGQTFRLIATAENLAALEVRSGAFGFREIVRRLEARSLHTIRMALICMDELAADEADALVKVSKLNMNDCFKAGISVVQAIVFQLEGPPGKKGAAKGR
jgi:hypothetical protein